MADNKIDGALTVSQDLIDTGGISDASDTFSRILGDLPAVDPELSYLSSEDFVEPPEVLVAGRVNHDGLNGIQRRAVIRNIVQTEGIAGQDFYGVGASVEHFSPTGRANGLRLNNVQPGSQAADDAYAAAALRQAQARANNTQDLATTYADFNAAVQSGDPAQIESAREDLGNIIIQAERTGVNDPTFLPQAIARYQQSGEYGQSLRTQLQDVLGDLNSAQARGETGTLEYQALYDQASYLTGLAQNEGGIPYVDPNFLETIDAAQASGRPRSDLEQSAIASLSNLPELSNTSLGSADIFNTPNEGAWIGAVGAGENNANPDINGVQVFVVADPDKPGERIAYGFNEEGPKKLFSGLLSDEDIRDKLVSGNSNAEGVQPFSLERSDYTPQIDFNPENLASVDLNTLVYKPGLIEPLVPDLALSTAEMLSGRDIYTPPSDNPLLQHELHANTSGEIPEQAGRGEQAFLGWQRGATTAALRAGQLFGIVDQPTADALQHDVDISLFQAGGDISNNTFEFFEGAGDATITAVGTTAATLGTVKTLGLGPSAAALAANPVVRVGTIGLGGAVLANGIQNTRETGDYYHAGVATVGGIFTGLDVLATLGPFSQARNVGALPDDILEGLYVPMTIDDLPVVVPGTSLPDETFAVIDDIPSIIPGARAPSQPSLGSFDDNIIGLGNPNSFTPELPETSVLSLLTKPNNVVPQITSIRSHNRCRFWNTN